LITNAQAQKQEISNAQAQKQEISNAKAQKQETSKQTKLHIIFLRFKHLIQSMVFTIQIRYKFLRL